MRLSGVILAGGKGERLFPITETRPKPLCPVGGKYPVDMAVKAAKIAGCEEITVTAGYLSEMLCRHFEKSGDVKVICERELLSTAGAVKNASPTGDFIIVQCGDAVCDFDLTEGVRCALAQNREVTVFTALSDTPTAYGNVLARGDRVIGFEEKPGWHDVKTATVNTGIYVLKSSVLKLIPEGKPFDFARDLFPLLMKKGVEIGAYPVKGSWIDMGTPASYFEANMRATGGLGYIAPDAVKEDGCSVTRSVVMENTLIGRLSTVEESIICENVSIGSGCRIGQGCIIGGNTVIGDGCVIMPGVRISGNAVIERDSRVMKNVYGDSFKKELFDCDVGIHGVYGSGFDIGDAVYLGQALCGSGKLRIGVMYGEGSFSRILAGVIRGGVSMGGGIACDMGRGYAAMCGFGCVKYGLFRGVFVDVDSDFGVTVSVFDGDGMYLCREDQLKLEKAFVRRDVKVTDGESDMLTLDVENEYKLSVRELLRGLEKLSVKGEGLPAAQLRRCMEDEKIPRGEGIVIDISDDGMRSGITQNGIRADYWHLWCYVMGEKVKNGLKTVALPVFSPTSADEYIRSLGGETVYYTDEKSDARTLAGVQEYANCGLLLCLKALKYMKESGITLEGMMAKLPIFWVNEGSMQVDKSEKAVIAGIIHGSCNGIGPCSTFVFDGGRVSVMPSCGNAFRLFAEATSAETAMEVMAEAKERIGEIRAKRE